MSVCDILIIGAGPAGCLAALGAYNKDPSLNIYIVEKNKNPVHKIGEALLTGTISVFDEAGIINEIESAGFHSKIGASYLWGKNKDKPWHVNYPGFDNYPKSFIKEVDDKKTKTAIHVDRIKFEKVLRNIIKNKVNFINDKVIDFKTTTKGKIKSVSLSSGEVFYPKYIIDASGPASVVGNKLGDRYQIGEKRAAKYIYLKVKDWSLAKKEGYHPNRTNILYTDNGWMWVIPLGGESNDLVSVGYVSEKENINNLKSFNDLKLAFGDSFNLFCFEENMYDISGNIKKDFYSRYNFSYISKKLNGNNWALAGDAALFIDPILSQGVTLASYYGYKRGTDAVDAIKGNTFMSFKTSKEYFVEALILIKVCKMWYDSENFVNDWHFLTKEFAKEHFKEDMSLEDSFRYISNLENLFNDFNPYPKDVWEDIEEHFNL